MLPFSGRLAASLGWRTTLRVYGLLALAFAGAWGRLAASEPAEGGGVSAAELRLLRSPKRAAAAASGSSRPPRGAGAYASLLCVPALWAIFLSHAAFNFGVYLLMSWQPTYYADVLSIPPDRAAVALAAPPALNLAVKVLVRAAKGCENPNFKGSYLGHFPLVSADFWTSEHLSERSRT